MDPARFKEAYERLQYLDERLTHKIRRRDRAMRSAGVEQLDQSIQDLSEYVVHLKEILDDLFVAIGSKPQKKKD